MSEQLLTVLKFCLLAVLYLFFFRVLRAVWAEINPPKPRAARRGRPAPAPVPVPVGAGAPAGGVAAAGAAAGARNKQGKQRKRSAQAAIVGRLVTVEPAAQRGRAYQLGDEITVGRAAGCGVVVDDTFVSQLHARVHRVGANYVVEDLGSTNGTFVNKRRVAGSVTLQRGDRLQVGNTVLELE